MEKTALLLYDPSPAHFQRLANIDAQWKILIAASEADAREKIKDADVVMGNHYLVQSLPAARKLKWIQSASSGIDYLLQRIPFHLKNCLLTNVSGVYDTEMAEHTLALLLSLYRQLPQLHRLQAQQVWERRQHLSTLFQSRVLLLGWGALGQAIAQRLLAFGVKLTVVSTTAPPVLPPGSEWVSAGHWMQSLPATDVLIIALPFTPHTEAMVNEEAINLLPPHAVVLNVGRARVLDEEALLDALEQNRIRAAALDVWSIEPLPASHRAWKMDNLIVSPHTARSLETDNYKYEALFEENFSRYVSGNPLLNVIDKERGY